MRAFEVGKDQHGSLIEPSGKGDRIMLKRRMHAILLALATLSCAMPGQPGSLAEPREISIGEEAAGSTVALGQGERLAVSLRGNPTTGFVWTLDAGAGTILESQGKPRFTPDSARLGAGGVYLFAFRALQPGSTHLRFVLRRPFDQDAPPAGVFEVEVVVGKAAP
jgi:inhibitor of cysteine peptidase